LSSLELRTERRAAWFSGGHRVTLLEGGDQLFAAMQDAIDAAASDVWVATYIFHDDATAQTVASSLIRAAERGVLVSIVVDGFGSSRWLKRLEALFAGTPVRLVTFRPLHRWYAYLMPGRMRRLHHKLCSVDDHVAFVGGINIVDDRIDVQHGPTASPRLDFAVRLEGPVALTVAQSVQAVWTRAMLGGDWRTELRALAASSEPLKNARALLQRLRVATGARPGRGDSRRVPPVRVALLIRDNLGRRHAIERAYVTAFGQAKQRIDLVCPYFFPGRAFRRALMDAARRGVAVRVLLQGKVDYRLAAVAARALYDEMLGCGIEIHEYMPAYLHAKVAVVDAAWATVGSSNIDPMSLVLNLEANVVVDDAVFAATLRDAIDRAVQQSQQVQAPAITGWAATVRRSLLAALARWFLRLAGVDRPY
jgi:cardiolipin synthase A/B